MQTYRADIDVEETRAGTRKRYWILSILGLLCALLFAGYIAGRAYLFDGLPPLPNKAAMWEMNLRPNTTLLDRDGKVIGHRGPYVGRPLKLSEMPAHLPGAFLAIEDERFYEHRGVDQKAILRAFIENTKSGGVEQGGSTLTQQLVKNMILTPEVTYRRKFQEMWLANEMEHTLSKNEILELYLNRIDLGSSKVYGVEAAAQRYFGKSAADVNIAEAALLAALPLAPSRLNPVDNFEGAWRRGQIVLERMLVNNMITLDDIADAERNPPVMIETAEDAINPALIGHVYDLIAEQAKGLVGSKAQDLIIRTTLDPNLQKLAAESLETVIAKSQEKHKVSDGALVTIDNKTGAVLAMIGGRDYLESKFNRAYQAERQPGSAFKAFVYAAALEQGFTPGTLRIDQPTEIGNWKPENYTKRYKGPMTIREALKLSINTIAAQIGAEVTPSRVGEIATRFGIKTEMRQNYSIALGSSEVTLYDLTAAYMVFANEGVRRRPYLIESIRDTSGKQLYTKRTTAQERVYSVPYARQMTSMLRDVIDTGTGYAAKLGSRQSAGKTGTSQDYRDAWFIGFTSQYTSGVWMGNDDNSPMVEITGGLLPVDAWKAYMRKAHAGLEKRPLRAPDPYIKDTRTRALISFYENMTDAFTEERNVASGIQTAANVRRN